MKARELRIDNLVTFEGTLIKVGYNEIRLQVFADCKNMSDSKGYSPIELTEDWLLKKFKFKKAIESEYTRDSFCKGKVSLWNKNLDFSVLIFTNTHTEIKYVHQLQNLYFIIMGEELTIG